MWSPNCLPELLVTIPSCFAELVFQAPPNAFRFCPAALQMPSPPCHVLRLRLSCRCGAPIASELPYACLPQLPIVFQARPKVIFRLLFICFLVAFERWSSKCLFICFPSLYMSPCVPCAARLAGCLSSLVSLHVSRGVPIQASGSSPAPFYFQRQKAVGFQFPEAGGHHRFSLRICAPGSGKLGTLSPTVSPSVSPPLSSTLSLT